MTEQQLHTALNSGRLSKLEIDQLVAELVKFPELTENLLQYVFEEDKTDSFNASWVFDHLMRKKLIYLLPCMDEFSKGLQQMTSESCIRPMAHTCQMLTEAHHKKQDEAFINNIDPTHLEQIMTTCFDWLIGDHKVATKVFAMTSLYYLGHQFDWIHPELRLVLEDTIAEGTAGYKNRAKKTLDKLAKLKY